MKRKRMTLQRNSVSEGKEPMIEICCSTGSDRIFRFAGLYDVLPAKYLPLTEEGNEFAFFRDLFRQNGILISGNGKRQPGEKLEFPCRFGGIGFTLIYDTFTDFVNFEVDDPAQRKALAMRLRELILTAGK